MRLKDVFAADVTRDIPPVVYFHEKDPQSVRDEVAEYIITGGYPESDPRHKRIESGIHEQFVRLLTGIEAELGRPHGVELPASWISGFYGSGKSSFAKLLGLALDRLILPDGTPLADALIARDDSPRAPEFRDAWTALTQRIDPMAVVFDIGAVARDGEHVHSAVKRMLQIRLGYCPVSHHVADYELKLELDGRWDAFLQRAEEVLGHSWQIARDRQLAEDDFSHVLHELNPDRYTDPQSWADSRGGTRSGIGTSVAETARSISDMLDRRAPGKTLFIVVDEVSQYIHRNESRMLKLQSLVSELGRQLKGRVWLLTTGQQKLEDEDDKTVLGKLKDRYPPRLRVHLSPTNIRDVVHKRLLKKAPDREPALRDLFNRHRSDLKLHGYACEAITEADFVEVYPLLPGHVDLLMRITSAMRLRSSRVKGDDYAIRGLLQLLGEMFREQALGEKPLGELVTLDRIYDVQRTALDTDIQNTMARILAHDEVAGDPLAVRVAKTVALLELIQDQTPTTSALISQCLYHRIGAGNDEPEIRKTLNRLCDLGLLSYSDKQGYKIQSSAGQEWQRERDARSVTGAEVIQVAAEKLKDLVGAADRPLFKRKRFPWSARLSDGKTMEDQKLLAPQDAAVITVDFRYLTADDRKPAAWVRASDTDGLRNRILWVNGDADAARRRIRELIRSRRILARYAPHRSSLSLTKQRLYYEEETRRDGLEKAATGAVAESFLDGEIYFRGRRIEKNAHGTAFPTVLHGVAESILPELFSRYVDMAVTPGELKQLLEKDLSGPSQKFMPQGLGIIDLDAGKYIPTCDGEIPARILDAVQAESGIGGGDLLTRLGQPPYGHPPDVITACLAGLLRAGKIRIRPDAGAEITSVRDPGARDIFEKDRDFKRADILPPLDQGINPRDRVAICKFFQTYLNVEIDRENDAIADAAFEHFPRQMNRIRDLERKWNRLPNRPDLPRPIRKLKTALEDCKRSRHVEPTLQSLKAHLDTLRDGTQELAVQLAELTDDSLDAVVEAMDVLQYPAAQLSAAGKTDGIEKAVAALEGPLTGDRPWRDIAAVTPAIEAIRERYREERLALIQRQEARAREIRERIKSRAGFEKLDADGSHQVLRPITEALYDTTPEAVQPTLETLRDSVPARLRKAEEEANARLDDILARLTQKQVVRLRHHLNGREFESMAEVDAELKKLRDRLAEKLDGKNDIRVRLV